ncbi:MAG TPA: M56 family metallopeptidase [Candidatus Binataceae bacterium]|nr:M56 family metallopeptidase [Candidatus Binataceae bacterium]
MSDGVKLCLVLAAAYGLACLSLAAVVAAAWRLGLQRRRSSAVDLLALRMAPPCGAALLTLSVVLPSFILYEPTHVIEPLGPALVTCALVAVAITGAGIARGWRACAAARRLIRRFGPLRRCALADGVEADIVDVAEPIVAAVGGWRPRIFAARQVLNACSDEEFRQVIRHEAAHVASADNLKLLMLVSSPDVLAWLPSGTALFARWRAAAEFEADERSAGADPHRRVVLASALIKVARLSNDMPRPGVALSLSVARDHVEARVRRLLSPSPAASPKLIFSSLIVCAALIPPAAVPSYALVHRLIEVLVAL